MAVDGAEFTGKTVEDAIARAESELGAHRDALTIDIISPGTRGVFGLGAEPARIRARSVAPPTAAPPAVEEATTPAPAHSPDADTSLDDMPDAEIDSAGFEPRDDRPSIQDDATPAAEAADPNLAADAQEVLRHLLHAMGFQAEVHVRSEQDPLILAITGENLGILIGRRGDNLSSLQFMVNLILSKNRRQWPHVVVDVENYRARREGSLRSLAERVAERVGRQGRPFTLEAMPASDRRIVHLSLRDREDVETYSIGEGITRRVVIAPLHGNAPPSVEPPREYRPYR